VRFVFLFCGFLSSSIAADFTCPASLTVKQTPITIPSGWEAISGSEPGHLDRVALYLNNPKEGGTLAPDKTDKTKAEETVTWRFVRAPGEEVWLGCVYSGTTVILARKLNSDVSKCVVRYDLLPSGVRLRLKGITCM
jgi:hypothetical protein